MGRESQLILFDVDGTLYDLHDVMDFNYKLQVDFYSGFYSISEEKTVRIFKEHGIFPAKSDQSKSATEFFMDSGIPGEAWRLYREKYFDAACIDASKAVDEATLCLFGETAPLVLLSSNSYRNIKRILKQIGISESLFEEILCSDRCDSENGFKKKREMRALAQRRKIELKNMLSIGDRYETDIRPALELGAMGIRVKGPEDLREIAADPQWADNVTARIIGRELLK